MNIKVSFAILLLGTSSWAYSLDKAEFKVYLGRWKNETTHNLIINQSFQSFQRTVKGQYEAHLGKLAARQPASTINLKLPVELEGSSPAQAVINFFDVKNNTDELLKLNIIATYLYDRWKITALLQYKGIEISKQILEYPLKGNTTILVDGILRGVNFEQSKLELTVVEK